MSVCDHCCPKQLPGLSENEHAQALLFLGHWLGDIHQPLHISYETDQGGNKVFLTRDSFYPPFKPKPPATVGDPMNLHSVWDGQIIFNARTALNMNVDELAQTLRGTITDAQRERWLRGTPLDWAQESYDISTAKDVDYCEWTLGTNGETCASEPQARKLTEAYQNEFTEVVKMRLQQAGVRLAAQIRTGLGL